MSYDSFTPSEDEKYIAKQGMEMQAKYFFKTEDLSSISNLQEFINHEAEVISCFMAEVRWLTGIIHEHSFKRSDNRQD